MSETKFFDYLVLGGEHHGNSYNGPYTRNLEVHANTVAMAKLYARDEPADTTIPEVVSYKVIEHSVTLAETSVFAFKANATQFHS